MPHSVTTRPWEKIGVDLFELNGKDFLITVDFYSNFWEVDKLPDTQSKTVITKLKSHFACYGILDHGLQFKSEIFSRFATNYVFEHTPSSPYNSKGNGKAESAVKAAKNLYERLLPGPTFHEPAYQDTSPNHQQYFETTDGGPRR